MKLEQITRMYEAYEILSYDYNTYIRVFDDNKTCVASFTRYGLNGEYRASLVGLGEHLESFVRDCKEFDVGIAQLRSPEYENAKTAFIDACKLARKAYWYWRDNYRDTYSDVDFEAFTDVAFAIDEMLE